MKIARVFPRKTKAVPVDDLAFYDVPGLFPPEVDEVHVSVTFTWDQERATYLAEQWKPIAPVKIGGPGWITDKQPYGDSGGEFIPGRYLKPGYTITSRGCNNRCWFCKVWKRGNIIEYPIKSGYNILDDNILLTSKEHFESTCEMLERQKESPRFTGGLEAKLLTEWHVKKIKKLNPKSMFFAYDTPDDYQWLRRASEMLQDIGFKSSAHSMQCFVLIGWEKDTIEKAQKRLEQVMNLGMFPMSMLYKNNENVADAKWIKFNTYWANSNIKKFK